MDKCDDHSGVCVRLDNLEDDMKNNVKKMNAIIILLIANLATVAVSAVFLYVKSL